MHILNLPLELLQAILCQCILVRGIRRGLRLRLVNRVFARQVVPTLYIYKLLDEHLARGIDLPPFTSSYVASRVLNEPTDGNPSLVCIRQIAERLSSSNNNIKACVTSLSKLVRGRECVLLFDPHDGRITPEDAKNHLIAAAIYTNNVAIVERWLPLEAAKTLEPFLRCRLFGINGVLFDAEDLLAKHGSEEMIELFLCDRGHGTPLRRRCRLLAKAGRAGRLEIVRYVYNFRRDDAPWCFDNPESYDFHVDPLKEALRTPSKEVWDFVMETRQQYPQLKPLEANHLTRSLYGCATLGWTEMGLYLLDLGADPDGQLSVSYITRIILAASLRGSLELVQSLLSRGVRTLAAVERASKSGHIDIVKVLLDYGAAVSGGLAAAAKGGYGDIVDLLLRHGANPNSIEDEGYRAIEHAVALEHVSMFNQLLKHGADLTQHRRWKQCVRIAEERGLESMLTLLRQHGDAIGIEG